MTRPFDFSSLPRTPKEETAELARRLERGELPETVEAELFARRNSRGILFVVLSEQDSEVRKERDSAGPE